MRSSLMLVLFVAIGNSSCALFEGARVRPRLSSDGVASGGAIPAGRTDPREPGRVADTRAPTTGGTTERRVCVASGWPREWIATSYELGASDCPKPKRDTEARAAIIVRHDVLPHSAVLEVCADQTLPRGWQEINRIEGDTERRCPGAREGGASAVRQIQRTH